MFAIHYFYCKSSLMHQVSSIGTNNVLTHWIGSTVKVAGSLKQYVLLQFDYDRCNKAKTFRNIIILIYFQILILITFFSSKQQNDVSSRPCRFTGRWSLPGYDRSTSGRGSSGITRLPVPASARPQGLPALPALLLLLCQRQGAFLSRSTDCRTGQQHLLFGLNKTMK